MAKVGTTATRTPGRAATAEGSRTVAPATNLRTPAPATDLGGRAGDLLGTDGAHWLASLSPGELEPAMGALIDALGRAAGGGSGSAARLGPGVPLPTSTRAEMEAHFGHDFSRVRVHHGVEAARAAAAAG